VPLFVIGCILLCTGTYVVDGLVRLAPEAVERRSPAVLGAGALGALLHVVGLAVALIGGVEFIGGMN